MLLNDDNKSVQLVRLEVTQGKDEKLVTIRHEFWNEILESLGYPRKKVITLSEDLIQEIEQYKQTHSIPDTHEAIAEAVKSAKRFDEEKRMSKCSTKVVDQ